MYTYYTHKCNLEQYLKTFWTDKFSWSLGVSRDNIHHKFNFDNHHIASTHYLSKERGPPPKSYDNQYISQMLVSLPTLVLKNYLQQVSVSPFFLKIRFFSCFFFATFLPLTLSIRNSSPAKQAFFTFSRCYKDKEFKNSVEVKFSSITLLKLIIIIECCCFCQ